MGELGEKIENLKALDDRLIKEELWIEKIARITHMEQFGKKITGKDGLGPYIFQWIFQLINAIILPVIAIIQFGWSVWYVAPLGFVLTFFGITFAVWATKKFRNIYYDSLIKLKNNKVIFNTYRYNPITPKSIKYIIYLLGFSALLLRLIYVDIIPIINDPTLINTPGPENLNIFANGIERGIIVTIIWMFIFLPLVAEFVSLFFGIHVYLPRRLKKYGIKIDYSDPYLLGGLEPIGKLLQASAGMYFIGLTVYLIATIGAQYRFGLASTAFFIGGWLLGFILFLFPQLVIHFQMINAKNEKVKELEKLMKKTGSDIGGPVTENPIDDSERIKYVYLYLKLNQSEKLKAYPFNMSTIRDLMLTAIIPITAEVCIRIYFNYLGI